MTNHQQQNSFKLVKAKGNSGRATIRSPTQRQMSRLLVLFNYKQSFSFYVGH